MEHRMQPVLAGALAVPLVALALAVAGPPAAAGPDSPSLARTLFDAVALHRWGHGALDWLLPDTKPEEKRP